MAIGIHLYLVRHGQTEWNLDRRLQGQLDSPLTAQGCEQARCIGGRLAELKLDKIVGSDLGRTLQTAEWVRKAMPVERRERLQYGSTEGFRERNLGRLQGRRIVELSSNDTEEYELCRFGDVEYRPQGGESRQNLVERGMAALEQLVAGMVGGESAAVISHGGLLGAILGEILGVPLTTRRNFYVANCALHHVVWRKGRFEVLTLGDVSHLNA